MKTQFNRIASALLSTMGILGVVSTQAQVQVPPPPQRPLAETFRIMIREGIIVPLQKPNWYRLNQQVLETKLKNETESAMTVPEVVQSLQELFGDKVNVREVDMFVASVGTQDFKAK